MAKKIYPVGTPVSQITRFDRSTKVAFKCPTHPEITWASKDPFVSTWFGFKDESHSCGCPTGQYVVAHEYTA